jgi:hypothetical protein
MQQHKAWNMQQRKPYSSIKHGATLSIQQHEECSFITHAAAALSMRKHEARGGINHGAT